MWPRKNRKTKLASESAKQKMARNNTIRMIILLSLTSISAAVSVYFDFESILWSNQWIFDCPHKVRHVNKFDLRATPIAGRKNNNKSLPSIEDVINSGEDH